MSKAKTMSLDERCEAYRRQVGGLQANMARCSADRRRLKGENAELRALATDMYAQVRASSTDTVGMAALERRMAALGLEA